MDPPAPSIKITNLSYRFADGSEGLRNVSLDLPAGSRTLLIGGIFLYNHLSFPPHTKMGARSANGAGKTTLLRLLAGKRLAPANTISIGGADPFTQGLEGVTYLGTEWIQNPIVRSDIGVGELLASVGGDHYRARRDRLVAMLDIDAANWRMHAVSDGERRRVQLAMGLVRPWTVLLLDEVTVDLDVLARARFLRFLRRETESRACTVVYATHILESAGAWATHLVRLTLGTVRDYGPAAELLARARAGRRGGGEEGGGGGDSEDGDSSEEDGVGSGGGGELLEVVLGWLKEDLAERGPRGASSKSEAVSYADMHKVEYGIRV